MSNKTKGGAIGYLKKAVVSSIVATVGLTLAFDADIAIANSNGNGATGASAQVTKTITNAKFKDVKADEYYYNAVNWAYEQGIINGYSNGTIFKPNDVVTEAQFVKMLSNYLNLEGSFKSVNNGSHWANDLYNTNLMYQAPLNGYKNTTLRNAPIKRGTVAQLISYYLNGDSQLDNSINYLLNNNITTGQNSSKPTLREKFGSNNTLTRAQAITFLYRMENKKMNRPMDGFNALIEMSLSMSADALYKKSCESVDGSLLSDKACKAPTTDNGNGSAVDSDLHPVVKEMFADPLKKALKTIDKSSLYDTLIEAHKEYAEQTVSGGVTVKGDTVHIEYLAIKGSKYNNTIDVFLTKTSIKVGILIGGGDIYSDKNKYGLGKITDLDYKYINKLLGLNESQIKSLTSVANTKDKNGMSIKSDYGVTFEANSSTSYVTWKKVDNG